MKRTKFTMLMYYIILGLLFMLNFYLIQAEESYAVFPMETQPKVEKVSDNSYRISFIEYNFSYNEVKFDGGIQCFSGQNFHQTFVGRFSLNFQSREWHFYFSIPKSCSNADAFLHYKMTASIFDTRSLYLNKMHHIYEGNNKIIGVSSAIDLPEKKMTTTPSQNIETQTANPKIQACEYSKTTVNYNQKVCKGELIFEDDFNQMDSNKWNRDIRIPLDTEDADFVSFQNFEQNLYIRDGILYILPKLLTEVTDYDETSIRNGTLNLGLNCTGVIDRSLECIRKTSTFNILPPVVSARIRTKHIFAFKYGVIEIRAKLPKGDWLFPQLFLEPSINHYGMANYSSGQIRIAFIRGNEMLDSTIGKQIDEFRLYGGVILVQGEKLRELWMKDTLRRRNHFGDDFHVYKTTWTHEFISFEVDGEEYGKFEGNFAHEAFDLNEVQHAEYWKTGNKMAPFDKEFFLSLGVSVGGISDFPDDSIFGKRDSHKKPWKNLDMKNELNFWKAKHRWFSTWIGENAALKVDYIRVWAE